MTSKESKILIKDLFVAELKNTQQYQIVLNLKQIILNEIATPNIQYQVIYNFETPQTTYDLEIIKMCIIIEFGFSINSLTNDYIIIDMKQFLE